MRTFPKQKRIVKRRVDIFVDKREAERGGIKSCACLLLWVVLNQSRGDWFKHWLTSSFALLTCVFYLTANQIKSSIASFQQSLVHGELQQLIPHGLDFDNTVALLQAMERGDGTLNEE